ncbi:MAG: hypothetical protein Fur0010_22240 [Bdellovibrio sp.]
MSESFTKAYNKFEETIGSMKFAVVIILIFTIFMTIGTFVESYHGTEFANRTVYKTWYFILTQGLMFLSILFAAFRRLPPKKRLYGFYTIHSGLIIIGIGSVATYIAGVDGSIYLPPNTPNREITLSDDLFRMQMPDSGRIIIKKLPNTAFKTNLNVGHEDVKLLDYYPYADREFTWANSEEDYVNQSVHSSHYLIENPNISQDFTLSLHPEAQDFESSINMGPLTVHYLPESLAPCFKQAPKSRIIVWDRRSNSCFTPESKKTSIQKSKTGNRFFVVKDEGKLLSFFPEVSPWPLDDNFQSVQNSPLRAFGQKLFEERPNLFLFGKSASFYHKDSDTWESVDLAQGKAVDLPWMGFTLTLIEHQDKKVPSYIPVPVLPIQKNGQLIKGLDRALKVQIQDKEYWVTNNRPIALMIDGKRSQLYITKETLTLPFEFVLTKFKMDKDPGTNNPASYESFVRVFSEKGPTDHHIYMNNPLKYKGFTFYQASYSQDQNGNYASTLSANVDPGRPLKYLGSILLVFGAMWHYQLNFSKRAKKKKTELIGVLS